MQQAFKLALSMVLLYWLALSLNWELPKYGALAIALISLDTTGASLSKGIMRIIGTTFGLGVGMLGLALFAQDSSLTLVYHALYLVVIGYFMQSSRYAYAWLVAGFMPSLVWATTYGKIDYAFSFATFRYLETTAGVVIYTAISIILWPQHAGDALNRHGQEFWQQFQELFATYRHQLEKGELTDDAPAKRAKLAGTLSQMLSTIDAAYGDTPSVASRKRAWESFRVASRATVDAMEPWQQSIADCRQLDLDRLLPQVHSSLETLQQRLARIESLWQARSAGEEASEPEDGDESLLQWQELKLVQDSGVRLSHLERAALLNFASQLNLLHRTSGRLLRIMRVLSDLSPVKELDAHALPTDLYRPPRWDAARFTFGLLPAVSFIVGWFFWIYVNPPTGPSVPNLAVSFGLMAVRTPMNVLRLVPIVFIVLWGLVAPVYFLVMPRLSTGPELLSLIFVFVFLARLFLVGRLTALRSVVLPAFVVISGISNNQSYSFMGIVSGAMLVLFALVIVGIVQTLMGSMKSEQTMLNSVRWFFSGCARVTSSYAWERHGNRTGSQVQRKRYLDSMVLPASAKVQALKKRLDYKQFPDNSPDKVQQLDDAMQSIVNRLQALENSQHEFANHAKQLPDSFAVVTDRLRVSLQSVFERWAKLEPRDVMNDQQTELKQFTHELESQFDGLQANSEQSEFDDEVLASLYATIGSVRGLVDAMANAQMVLNQINWNQWATPRF
ncbi:FUSC family protein [Novipirellula artificiosorum]|uniref:Fusaric acid resistance protein family protein n=1 Tax=Novipirellula artificiosorum TaxID=2528016 RepID=A0A5C6DNK8_9BACT|nr:FUSC family protein [Novipirellula artificiosorum]TWU37457.1 Fusaric acid resistance protein family protein [Novipirellula artificiosorum]